MKKILSVLFIFLLVLSLPACGDDKKNETSKSALMQSYDYSDWQKSSFKDISYKTHNWEYDPEHDGEGNSYEISFSLEPISSNYIYVSYSDFDSTTESEEDYYSKMKNYYSDHQDSKLLHDEAWSNGTFNGHQIQASFSEESEGVDLNNEFRVVKFFHNDVMYSVLYGAIYSKNTEAPEFDDWDAFLNTLTVETNNSNIENNAYEEVVDDDEYDDFFDETRISLSDAVETFLPLSEKFTANDSIVYDDKWSYDMAVALLGIENVCDEIIDYEPGNLSSDYKKAHKKYVKAAKNYKKSTKAYSNAIDNTDPDKMNEAVDYTKIAVKNIKDAEKLIGY